MSRQRVWQRSWISGHCVEVFSFSFVLILHTRKPTWWPQYLNASFIASGANATYLLPSPWTWLTPLPSPWTWLSPLAPLPSHWTWLTPLTASHRLEHGWRPPAITLNMADTPPITLNMIDAPEPPPIPLNMADAPPITLNMIDAPEPPPITLNMADVPHPLPSPWTWLTPLTPLPSLWIWLTPLTLPPPSPWTWLMPLTPTTLSSQWKWVTAITLNMADAPHPPCHHLEHGWRPSPP